MKPRLALIFWPFELDIPGPQLTASRFRAFRHHDLLCSNGARDRIRLTHEKYALEVAFMDLSSSA